MTTSNYFYKTKFDIHPSEGVGFLKLGLSLYQVLKLLNENNMDSNIRFVYDDKLTNKMPITLQLKTNMLDLTFDSHYQKLILIELKSWNEFTSFYHNNLPLINESPASSSSVTTTSPSTTITTTTTTNISTNTTPLITTSISPSSSQSSNTTSTNTSTNISTNTTVTSDNSYLNSNSNTNSNTNSHLQPNFKSLYNKIFGPTYPGYYDTLTKSYLLSYPGICFKFKIPDSIVSKFDQFDENPHDENLIRLLDRYSTIVNCSSFVIFKGQSWNEELINLKSIILNNYDLSLLNFTNNLNLKKLILNSNINFNKLSNCLNNLKQIVIENCHVIIPLGLIFIKFLIHNKNYILFKIEIGKTTMHDVIKFLGQPSNYLNKLVDSNSINNYNDINGIIASSSPISTNSSNINNNSRNVKNTTNNNTTNNTNKKSNNNDEINIIKIHNYFEFGLDFIYDTSKSINGSCPIKKIVIHNNPINSLEFGNYEKLFCYFTGYNNKINLLQNEFKNLREKNNINTKTNNNNNNNNNTKITSIKSNTTTITTNDNEFKNLDEDEFKIYKDLIFDVNENTLIINSNDLYNDFATDFNNKLNQPVFLNRQKFQLNNSGWDNSGTVQSFSNFEVIDFEDEFEDDNTLANALSMNLSISNNSMSDIDPSSTTNTAYTENTTNNNNNNIPDDESSKIVKEWGLSKLYGIERCIFEILIDNGSISGVTLF